MSIIVLLLKIHTIKSCAGNSVSFLELGVVFVLKRALVNVEEIESLKLAIVRSIVRQSVWNSDVRRELSFVSILS